jgi:type II secretion system protein J
MKRLFSFSYSSGISGRTGKVAAPCALRRGPDRQGCGQAGGPGRLRIARANRAFTLLEVILAVALSALLLAIVYGAYFSIHQSIQAATEAHDALDTGRTLSELLKKDIRGMIAPRYPLAGKTGEVAGELFSQVEFVTNGLVPTDPLRFRRVAYLMTLNEKRERVFVRRESKYLDKALDENPSDDPPKAYEVSKIVTKFLIDYYNGNEWVQAWDSTTSNNPPAQVRVTIGVADETGKERTFVIEEAIQSDTK